MSGSIPLGLVLGVISVEELEEGESAAELLGCSCLLWESSTLNTDSCESDLLIPFWGTKSVEFVLSNV